ncbi:MAG: DUF445 family protein [Cytophagales bacterium]|nr:DUF445 family protein [Bernardetiaceae bacterium]MDW8204379.1 DUF445 family protein [Cytophagales bacterium]
MLTTLLAKVISGAYVGYATNDLAIQMLFRKRFGLGGIVLRTRDEFIDNISRLVERDIINHHTLSRELAENPGAFQDSLANAVQDLAERSLWLYLPENEPIGFLAGFDASVQRITDSARQLLHDASVKQSFEQMIGSADIGLLLTPNVLTALEKCLIQLLQQVQQTHPLLAGTISYSDFQQLTFADILSPTDYQALGRHLTQPLRQLYTVAGRASTETFFETAELLLLNPEWLNLVAARLRTQTVGAWLGEENGKALVNTLAERLLAVVEAPEGRQVLEGSARFFWEVLGQEKTTVFSLLNENLAERFDAFLRGYLPLVLQKLIEWLQSRRHQLEAIIDSTFRRNIKWKFQDIILQLFVGSISQYADVVRRITDILDKHSQNPAETAKMLTEQIIRFLKENTIGQIVQQLRQNENRLRLAIGSDAENTDPLATLLQKAIAGLLQSPADSVLRFSTLAERPLGNFISQEETVRILQQALRYIWQEQAKKRWLYAPAASVQLEQAAYKRWMSAYHCSWGTWISEPRFHKFLQATDAKIPALLQGILAPNAAVLQKMIQQELPALIMSEQAERLITGYVSTSLQRLGTQPWHIAREAFQSWSLSLPARLQQLLLQNLEFLLTGRIEAVVRNSLQKMPNEKLLDLVERFMGRELKPITLLGALLGGIAGSALAFLPPINGNDFISWQDTALAATAYGITGYGTNWLALRMIFRPYRPIEWKKGSALPFTPGVVAKNQARFAENMGKFVAGGLLNSQNIAATFADKKELIRRQAREYAAQPDLLIPGQWLQNNRAAIAAALTDWAAQLLPKHQVAIKAQVAEKAATFPLEKLPWESIRKKIAEQLTNAEGRKIWAEKLTQVVIQNLQNTPALKDWLGEEWSKYAATGTELMLPVLTAAVRSLTIADLKRYLLPPLEQVWQRFNEAPLGQYVGTMQQDRLKARLNRALEKQLKGESLRQLLYQLIENRLAQEFNPQRKISDLFNGQLMAVITHNLDNILDGFIAVGLSWLQDNKEMLAEKVYQQAYAQSKAGAFVYKSTIKDSVIELAEQGIPEFFRRESKGLKDLIGEWTAQLGETPLSAIGVRVDELYLKQLTDTLLAKPELYDAASRALSLLVDELVKMPVAAFANVLQISNAESLWQRTEPIVSTAWEELRELLQRSLPELLPLAMQAAFEMAKGLYGTLSPAMLATMLNKEELATRIEATLQKYFARPATHQWLQNALYNFQEQLKGNTLGDVLPTEKLAAQTFAMLHQLFANKESRQAVHQLVESLLSTLLPKLPHSLVPETLQSLANALIDAVLHTAEQHLPAIVNAVDIGKVVVREISEMHPKEIEDLFYSFAARYFRQLINYGFGFGIMFGLAIDSMLSLGMSRVLYR